LTHHKNYHLCDWLKASLFDQYDIKGHLTKDKHLFLFDKNKNPIPLILYKNCGAIFEGISLDYTGECFTSPFFILKSLDKKRCCAVLGLLQPVGIDGCTVEFTDSIYSLLSTDNIITVSLKQFTGLQTFPCNLVNRPIPEVDSKKC
jgi:hypothetical protein